MNQKVNFIDAKKAISNISRLCSLLEISRDAYYKHKTRGTSSKHLEDLDIGQKMKQLHKIHRGVYGVVRTRELLKQHGVNIGVRRTRTIFKQQGLYARGRKHSYKIAVKPHKIHANTLERAFNPTQGLQVLCTDITYIKVNSSWVYLSVILDLSNRKVLAWKVSDRCDADLAVDTLRKLPPLKHGFVVHSDQGSTYTSKDWCEELESMVGDISMSRRGNCWDNAPMESFFKTLKTEMYSNVFGSVKELELELFSYVEFYNNLRLHSTLGYETPKVAGIKNMLKVAKQLKDRNNSFKESLVECATAQNRVLV